MSVEVTEDSLFSIFLFTKDHARCSSDDLSFRKTLVFHRWGWSVRFGSKAAGRGFTLSTHTTLGRDHESLRNSLMWV